VVLESLAITKKPRNSNFARANSTLTPEVKKTSEIHDSGKIPAKPQAPKQAGKPEEKIKQNTVAQKRRLFNRKSGQ
jgi:hypothetical protein